MSTTPTPPAVALAFTDTSWKAMEIQEIKKHLLEAIVEDPEIGRSTNIAVNVRAGAGGTDPEIELAGKVDSDKDKARAEEVVRINTRDEAEITNNLIAG
jgi:hypothetical protein